MPVIHLSEDEISEFKIESLELLDIGESSLLSIEKGENFRKHYDAIFRAFHSVKGAAGMLNWSSLQNHMHLLENHFQSCKEDITLSKSRISYFLDGIDAAKNLLELREIKFNYELPGDYDKSSEENLRISQIIQPLNELSLPQPTAIKNGNLSIPAGTKVPVFVLDDERDIVEIISENLTDAGYEVYGFTDAQEALKEVSNKRPQVFFSDMNMPELSGLDVLRELNKIDSDIPLVYVSAHLSKEILLESLGFGIYGAIEKPFSGKQILSIAKAAIKKYQVWKLLNRSINLIMFQFSSLDSYLLEKGKIDYRTMIVNEMQRLLELRRELKGIIST